MYRELTGFLLQTIFADRTYSKPFFVTYFNTSLFTLPLFSIILRRLWRLWRTHRLVEINSVASLLRHLDEHDSHKIEVEDEQTMLQSSGDEDSSTDNGPPLVPVLPESENHAQSKLGLRATARLSIKFCLLWVRSGLNSNNE